MVYFKRNQVKSKPSTTMPFKKSFVSESLNFPLLLSTVRSSLVEDRGHGFGIKWL